MYIVLYFDFHMTTAYSKDEDEVIFVPSFVPYECVLEEHRILLKVYSKMLHKDITVVFHSECYSINHVYSIFEDKESAGLVATSKLMDLIEVSKKSLFFTFYMNGDKVDCWRMYRTTPSKHFTENHGHYVYESNYGCSKLFDYVKSEKLPFITIDELDEHRPLEKIMGVENFSSGICFPDLFTDEACSSLMKILSKKAS